MKQLSLGLLALMSTCAQRPAPPVPVSVPQGTSVSSAALVGSYAVQSRVPNFKQPVYDRLRYTPRASTLARGTRAGTCCATSSAHGGRAGPLLRAGGPAEPSGAGRRDRADRAPAPLGA